MTEKEYKQLLRYLLCMKDDIDMRDDPNNPNVYIINCDGCDAEMRGVVSSVLPPYAVDALTFSKHEYYCSACWKKMRRAVGTKVADKVQSRPDAR